jgi:hypothetical protein
MPLAGVAGTQYIEMTYYATLNVLHNRSGLHVHVTQHLTGDVRSCKPWCSKVAGGASLLHKVPWHPLKHQ